MQCYVTKYWGTYMDKSVMLLPLFLNVDDFKLILRDLGKAKILRETSK